MLSLRRALALSLCRITTQLVSRRKRELTFDIYVHFYTPAAAGVNARAPATNLVTLTLHAFSLSLSLCCCMTPTLSRTVIVSIFEKIYGIARGWAEIAPLLDRVINLSQIARRALAAQRAHMRMRTRILRDGDLAVKNDGDEISVRR
jgi:hypothetical protein